MYKSELYSRLSDIITKKRRRENMQTLKITKPLKNMSFKVVKSKTAKQLLKSS